MKMRIPLLFFDTMPLSANAVAVVQTMTPIQRRHLVDAVEHFALISHRPIVEIAERLLRGYDDVIAGRGSQRLSDLIVDVLMDDDTDIPH